MENNYEYIANPVNGERFQTNSLEGKTILKNLIKSSLNGDNSIQIGGLKEEHLGKFLNTLLTEDLSHKKVFLEYLKMIWKNDDDIKLKDFIDHLNKWVKENEEPNDKNDQLNKNLKKLNYELLNPFSPEIIKFNYNTDTKKFQPLADSSSEYFTLLESESGLIYDLLKDNQNLIDKRIFYYKITASENIIADTIYLLRTVNDRPYPLYIKINTAKKDGETFYAQSEGYRENDKFWLVEADADKLTEEQKEAAFELTKYIDENALGKALKNLKECLLNIIQSNKSIAENISFEIELTNDKQYNFFLDADNYDNYDIDKFRWEELNREREKARRIARLKSYINPRNESEPMIDSELDSLIKHVQIFDNTKQDPIVLKAMEKLKQLKAESAASEKEKKEVIAELNSLMKRENFQNINIEVLGQLISKAKELYGQEQNSTIEEAELKLDHLNSLIKEAQDKKRALEEYLENKKGAEKEKLQSLINAAMGKVYDNPVYFLKENDPLLERANETLKSLQS